MSQFILSDSTLRDGIQGGIVIPLDDHIEYYNLLSSLNRIIPCIHELELFYHTPGHRDVYAALRERHAGGETAEPTIWLNYYSLEELAPFLKEKSAVSLYIPKSTVLAPDEAGLSQRLELLASARCEIRLHFEEIGRYSRAHIIEFYDLVREHLGGGKIEIQLSDTYGDCVPQQTPDAVSVSQIIGEFEAAGISKDALTLHFHDDRGLAVANTFASFVLGCSRIDGAFFGAGERGGLTPLETLVSFMARGSKIEDAVSCKLSEIAQFLSRRGLVVSHRSPYLGDAVRLMSAGKLAALHKRGMNDLVQAYIPIITQDTGHTGVAYLINKNFGMNLDRSDSRVQELWRHLNQQILICQRALREDEFILIARDFVTERKADT